MKFLTLWFSALSCLHHKQPSPNCTTNGAKGRTHGCHKASQHLAFWLEQNLFFLLHCSKLFTCSTVQQRWGWSAAVGMAEQGGTHPGRWRLPSSCASNVRPPCSAHLHFPRNRWTYLFSLLLVIPDGFSSFLVGCWGCWVLKSGFFERLLSQLFVFLQFTHFTAPREAIAGLNSLLIFKKSWTAIIALREDPG